MSHYIQSNSIHIKYTRNYMGIAITYIYNFYFNSIVHILYKK